MRKVLRWSIVTPFFLFVLTFLAFIHNNSSGVYGGDVGDFLSAIAVKGIPHPSGYPLFTMLGILFNYLPINQPMAWKVGLVSVIFSSLSVLLMYLITYELVKNKIVSIIASFALAFFYPFWLYAELAEVFALNIFFILLLVYTATIYFQRKNIRYLYFLAFFIGLSLTNNQVIILIFPAIFMLVLLANWRILLKLKTILFCIILFFVGLLPYLYIPIAAYFNPPVNWLTSFDFKHVLRLILRLDYNSITDSSLNYYFRYLPLKAYFNYLFIQLTPPVFITSIIGIFYMFLNKKKILSIFLFLIFFFTGPFFIAYGATPLITGFSMGVVERFYIMSATILIIYFSFGLGFIVNVIMKTLKYATPNLFKNASYKYFFTLVFMIIPLYLFVYNFPKTDLHDMLWGDYMAEDILFPLPKNSILFVSGDTTLFNLLYIQYAKGFRKDVAVINMGRLDYDKLFIKEKKEILNKSPKMPEDVLNVTVVTSLSKKRPVFSLFNIQHKDKKNGEIEWMPYGLMLELADKKDQQKTLDDFLEGQNKLWKTFHPPGTEVDKKSSAHGLSLTSIPALYSAASVNTGNYLVAKYNNLEKAKEYYQKAVKYAPTETGGYKGLGYYYLNKKDCKKAENNFNRHLYLDPSNRMAYISLYITYNNCYKNEEKSNSIKKQFQSLFNIPIENEIKSVYNQGSL